jgi:disulfide oxidoreductase YuzD
VNFHKFADLFPMMQADELDQLVADIKQNGLLEPIVTYEDKILDGRNRCLVRLWMCGIMYPQADELTLAAF